MKPKTLIILVLIAGALGALSYMLFGRSGADNETRPLGRRLFARLPVNAVASIRITSADEQVGLAKGQTVWEVGSRFGYPADYDKIRALIKKIRDLKIGRSFGVSDAVRTRQSLYPPEREDLPADQRGIRVVLADARRQPLADVILGKDRQGVSGGHYVLPADGETVYLVDKSFKFIDRSPTDWLEADLLDVAPDAVSRVICLDPIDRRVIYSIGRRAPGESPLLENPPPGGRVSQNEIDRVVEALSAFDIEDVADPALDDALTGIGKLPYFEYHLFDGTVFRVYPGRVLAGRPEQFYFRVAVDRPPDVASQKEQTSSETAAAKAAPDIRKDLDQWTYVISNWAFETFVIDPQKFLEQQKDDAA